MKKKIWRTAIIGNIPVILICVLLLAFESFAVLNNALFDFDMKTSMNQEYHQDIVVVGIDDQSLKDIGAFPWDRKAYIPVIQKLESAGAKVIAFDVMFNAPGNVDSDKLFADELAKYKNIILPVQAVFEGGYNDFDNGSVVSGKLNEPMTAKGLTTPIPLFGKVTQAAHINADIDPDHVIRRTFTQISTPEGIIPSLAVKAFELAGGDSKTLLQKYPRNMGIRYDLLSSDIKTFSLSKIKDGDLKDLKDRIVLIGYTANGFENDDGITPVEKKSKLVYVHANIINQLMSNLNIAPENSLFTLGMLVLLFLLTLLFTWRFKPTTSVIIMFGLIVILLGVQLWLFSSKSVYINTVYPIVTLIATFFVNISIKTFYETKQKNYITKQFGRYISPDLVKEIAKSDQEIQLGGINKELTILFLDVRGFTPLSEKLQPEEVVGFLNMLFNLITEKALINYGTIDKFIGDAAMILYNAPLDVAHHEYFAVKTAFDIQEGMKKVREDIFTKYEVNISVGIGINTGQVVVGNIGSYLRIDYTAIGDNVNTAARIESNTEPNQILVSESTYDRTKDYFEYNCIGEKMMKGKSLPVKLYEVIEHTKAAAG